MVSSGHFAQVAESSKYDSWKYADHDCQDFVECVLYDSGVRKPDGSKYNWKGSNSMWRSALSWRGTIAEAVEKFGQIGSMPVRGWFPYAAVEDKSAGVVWAAQLACRSRRLRWM